MGLHTYLLILTLLFLFHQTLPKSELFLSDEIVLIHDPLPVSNCAGLNETILIFLVCHFTLHLQFSFLFDALYVFLLSHCVVLIFKVDAGVAKEDGSLIRPLNASGVLTNPLGQKFPV